MWKYLRGPALREGSRLARGVGIIGIVLLGLTTVTGAASASSNGEGSTQTIYGDAGRAEISFFTEDDFPIFSTRYGVRVKVFDTAADKGCAVVKYDLVQNNSGDNKGDQVEACGVDKDSGEPKVFTDKPLGQEFIQVNGWKFQVCKKKFLRPDDCGEWQYFEADGTPRPNNAPFK